MTKANLTKDQLRTHVVGQQEHEPIPNSEVSIEIVARIFNGVRLASSGMTDKLCEMMCSDVLLLCRRLSISPEAVISKAAEDEPYYVRMVGH